MTTLCCGVRESTGPRRAGGHRRAAGQCHSVGGSDEREPRLAKGLTDAFFCSGVAEHHVPEIECSTRAGGFPDYGDRRIVGAVVTQASDGQEEESRLKHISIRVACRGWRMAQVGATASGGAVKRQLGSGLPPCPEKTLPRRSVTSFRITRITGDVRMRKSLSTWPVAAALLLSFIVPAAALADPPVITGFELTGGSRTLYN